jgi:hypothetical protein
MVETQLYTGCFEKSFTTLKAYRKLYRGHTQGFELSKCSQTHQVLPRIVIVQCEFIGNVADRIKKKEDETVANNYPR